MSIIMALKTASEIVAKQTVQSTGVQEQTVPDESVGQSSGESTVVKAIDRKARGYLKTIERSFSSSSLERKPSLGEDPSAMTIEFLRSRLQSERSVSKAERQRAQQLAKKVLELERKLSIEIQQRKKAEAGKLEVGARHENDFTGPDDLLLSNTRGDESDKNSEDHREEGSGRVRSRFRSDDVEYFSTSVEDEDGCSDGGTDKDDQCGSARQLNSDEGGNEDNIDGDEEGHRTGSPWQHNRHWEVQRSFGKRQNKEQKEQWQSSRRLLPEQSSRTRLEKESNATSSDEEALHRGRMRKSVRHINGRETRLQQTISQIGEKPGQVAEGIDGQAIGPKQKTFGYDVKGETEMQNVPECEAKLIVQNEAEKALRTWEDKFAQQNSAVSIEISPDSGLHQKFKEQIFFPSVASKEEHTKESGLSLRKEASGIEIGAVTHNSGQHLEGVDELPLQGETGPISVAGKSDEGRINVCKVPVKIPEVKGLKVGVDVDGRAICHPYTFGGLSQNQNLAQESGKVAPNIGVDNNTCCYNEGVASRPSILQGVKESQIVQEEIPKAEVETVEEKQDEGYPTAMEVQSEFNNENQILSEKKLDHFGVIACQELEASGSAADTPERKVDLVRGKVAQNQFDRSDISAKECGGHMEGWPVGSPAGGEVGSFNTSLRSSFKFNVHTDYSNGKITKENLVIESSQSGKFMGSSMQEPDHSAAASCYQQQGWSERPAQSMREQEGLSSKKRVMDFVSRDASGHKENADEREPSRGPVDEGTAFAGEMQVGDWPNRYQPIPPSRFNDQRRHLQDHSVPRGDFSFDQPKQAFVRDTRDRGQYERGVAHDSQDASYWMDARRRAGSDRFTNSNWHASYQDITPFGMQENHSTLYLREGQDFESEAVPGIVNGRNRSQAARLGRNGITDRNLSQISPEHIGTRNLQDTLIHDRSYGFRDAHLDLLKDSQQEELSVRRLRAQEIDREEPRSVERYFEYPYYPDHLGADGHGRQALHIAPLNERSKPEFISPPHRTAIPAHFSHLQNEVGGYARQDTHMLGHRMSVDGGFDRVKEILKALDIAKQQVQISTEAIPLPAHLEAVYASGHETREQALVRAESSPELPLRYLVPSRLSVEGVPHRHRLSQYTRVAKKPAL